MILCCGEALIDMLPRQATTGGACFQPFSGGAVFNTSIALGRLGAPAGLFSGLSNDLFGAQLVATLTDSGVDTDLAVRSDRPSTLAFVELTDGQARYAFYDENTAGRMLSVDDLPPIPADVSTLFFGGISLAVEPCGATYEHLMLTEGTTRVTMIDPNIRPGFIKDESAYRARLDRMIRAADIVKLSDEDLHWLVGIGDSRELARKVLAMGPRLVCITEGAKGAWGITADHDVFVNATKVTPVDTVGAGDTFNAGVLAALHEAGALAGGTLATLSEEVIRDAVRLATHAAAVTVSREGANPPRRSELA
ncbi:carbohydrate kinase [Pseudoruegeria sp. SK021]|uniref:carbohydrate kinase family protein n=1 Tax=Pseudoruegeria sp. SK021 TaxID=1933035 RepID=UPI000A24904F|nr:carbohydrate kinase [Pseudoruegeria sp. SK021]OSP54977.1 carbohydrate kinase [Pseudoruegeria sp. SK021]